MTTDQLWRTFPAAEGEKHTFITLIHSVIVAFMVFDNEHLLLRE